MRGRRSRSAPREQGAALAEVGEVVLPSSRRTPGRPARRSSPRVLSSLQRRDEAAGVAGGNHHHLVTVWRRGCSSRQFVCRRRSTETAAAAGRCSARGRASRGWSGRGTRSSGPLRSASVCKARVRFPGGQRRSAERSRWLLQGHVAAGARSARAAACRRSRPRARNTLCLPSLARVRLYSRRPGVKRAGRQRLLQQLTLVQQAKFQRVQLRRAVGLADQLAIAPCL